MNYFSLFEIPESLKVDEAAIMKAYYRLSRRYHPDANINAGDPEQAEAERMSALINQARQVLSRSDLRLEYLLELHGVITPDEKYQLPPAFLSQVMEINEKLMELEFDQDAAAMQAVRDELSQLEDALSEPVKPYFSEDVLQFTDAAAESLKEYYYKKKYLQRIRERFLRLS